MVYQSRTRKRVYAIRRGPDGSAFEKWEEFVETCDQDENEIDVDRKGFETWKNMLEEERHPYSLQAEKVNSAFTNALLKGENDTDLSWVDDEADSAEVGKYDKNYRGYEFRFDSENSDSYGIFWSETSDSLESKLWARMWPRIVKKSSRLLTTFSEVSSLC